MGPRFECVHCPARFSVCVACEPRLAAEHPPRHVFLVQVCRPAAAGRSFVCHHCVYLGWPMLRVPVLSDTAFRTTDPYLSGRRCRRYSRWPSSSRRPRPHFRHRRRRRKRRRQQRVPARSLRRRIAATPPCRPTASSTRCRRQRRPPTRGRADFRPTRTTPRRSSRMRRRRRRSPSPLRLRVAVRRHHMPPAPPRSPHPSAP